MALPLLTTLNKGARAALPVIQSGVSFGLSASAISDILKETFGKSIRRSTLLQIIRAEKGITERTSQLKFLPRNARPNINRLPEAITRIRRRYSYIVKLTGISATSGVAIEQNVTVSTDQILTRGEIEDFAEQAIADNRENYDIAELSATLLRGLRAGPAGVL